jgi:hypothetical protein
VKLHLFFQVEIGGKILGKGVGATWEEAKLQVVSRYKK